MITIDTSKLKSALDHIKPIIGRRTTLPILSCVRLHTEPNGLYISASNLDEFVTERVECDGKFDPVCVSFNYLYNSLIGPVATIESVKGGVLIKCGDDETKIASLDAEEFPPEPKFMKHQKHGVACADLSSAVSQAAWAASTDPVRYILNSVFITSKAKKLAAVATNGRELALVEMALIGSDFEVLVPSEFVSNFTKFLLRDGAALASNENQIKVSHSSGDYFCKQVEGVYPNFRQVIPVNPKLLGCVSVEETAAVVSGCVVFGDGGEARGIFDFSEKEMRVDFTGANGSVLSRHMPGRFEPFKVGLSTKKMAMIFRQLKSDTAKLFYVDELSPIMIESGDLTVVTMVMRLG